MHRNHNKQPRTCECAVYNKQCDEMKVEVEVEVENEKSNGDFEREIVCSVAVKGMEEIGKEERMADK